ncbi:peptidoglycan editing factor PgeF [Thermoactinomyces intermedius]|jgi:polyphenol oxidase|uniref:Purine nucleoside phosphorylase n=1 Tax=Thermoactinomyces intermedius TaxID=2024 RepID=A0A8I1DE13_THEIN|nr:MULTISPECIES: peptidoglycan editing factor PgeF [Thermoactinomyces]MBA4547546.1 peptidoglycan editing factor PgeF [Thermoactinomyces intermedius]MBA4836186.1 peptidoglycan editing factor PgeF [Thermoactinomyces intermedius]MBH8594225.1 peptidoglycan editing factor PgeF [Thermoactinomyces intermedius]MBH8601061.1 peptidoglycan editing factor PgeF [Thermoactinomyces sp. CICC 23799]
MEPFRYQQKNGVPYFTVEEWERMFPHLTVGFSAKDHKEDKFCRNYALHVGDQPEQVLSNRKELSDALQMPFSAWTCGEQVHGVHIETVGEKHRGYGKDSRKTAFQDTDGMVTNETGILLAAYFADCVPLYFYAPDVDWIGIAHAGWKGTVGGIGSKMVGRFTSLGADPGKIRVVIGPSIGSCCYEVDERVYRPLENILSDEKALNEVAVSREPGRWQLDLKKANAKILEKAGVHPRHILLSRFCTSCDQDYFYSHRRDQGETGRMVAYIGKKERGSE